MSNICPTTNLVEDSKKLVVKRTARHNGKPAGTWMGADVLICSGERGMLPPPEPVARNTERRWNPAKPYALNGGQQQEDKFDLREMFLAAGSRRNPAEEDAE